MSSSGCKLQQERPKRPGEFTFTWSVENYSYCRLKEGYGLHSPSFVVEFLGNEKWKLRLHPGGTEGCPGFISCYLYQVNDTKSFNFTLSIRMQNGQFKEGSEAIYINNRSSCYANGYSKFVSLQDLKGPDGYLVSDTLTLRCRIWKTDAELVIPTSMYCDVHSRIKVSELDYMWILNGIEASLSSPEILFRHSLNISDLLKEMPSLKIHVFNEGNCDASALYIGMEMGEREKTYNMICLIHLIDARGRIVHTARCHHSFEYSSSSEVFNFPIISMDKFFINKALYLPNGELKLQLKLGLSVNELETFVYHTTKTSELQPSMNNPDTDGHELWIKNVKECYEYGKFSDFIIRTPSRQFPVSKSILCAQSAVFEAMFERDMKERKTGIVDIEDLDDDTISLMLIYVYTNTIEFIDSSAALKLYFAADKYGITALQKKCFNYLKSSLDESNVCEVLVLADMHQDHDLKSCSRDFIQAYARKILNSESWKKLEETNPHLVNEIMHWIICN